MAEIHRNMSKPSAPNKFGRFGTLDDNEEQTHLQTRIHFRHMAFALDTHP